MVKKLIAWMLKHVEIEIEVDYRAEVTVEWVYSTRWDCWLHTSELEYAWSNSEGWRGYFVGNTGRLVWGNELFTEDEVKRGLAA